MEAPVVSAENGESFADFLSKPEDIPEKRGRGRPKGSTKKTVQITKKKIAAVDKELAQAEKEIKKAEKEAEGLEEMDDEELEKVRHQLKKMVISNPDFFASKISLAKIDKMTGDQCQRRIELAELQLFSQYDTELVKGLTKIINFVPKKALKMNEEQAAKLDVAIQDNEPFQRLTKQQLTVTLLSKLPTGVKWTLLYGAAILDSLK